MECTSSILHEMTSMALKLWKHDAVAPQAALYARKLSARALPTAADALFFSITVPQTA